MELDHIRVQDVMHHGILSCSTDAPLAEVATVMAEHRVHAVVVTGVTGSRPVGVVSDLDVVAAASNGGEMTAGEVAATEPLVVAATERLDRAAQLMSEHAVSHLVVLDAASGLPVGILSTLDIASVCAELMGGADDTQVGVADDNVRGALGDVHLKESRS